MWMGTVCSLGPVGFGSAPQRLPWGEYQPLARLLPPRPSARLGVTGCRCCDCSWEGQGLEGDAKPSWDKAEKSFFFFSFTKSTVLRGSWQPDQKFRGEIRHFHGKKEVKS